MKSYREWLDSKMSIDKETGWILVQTEYQEWDEDDPDEVKPKIVGPFYVIPGPKEYCYYEYVIFKPSDNGEYKLACHGISAEGFDEESFAKEIKRIQESERIDKEIEAEADAWLDEQFPEVKEGKPPKEPLGSLRYVFACLHASGPKITLPIDDVEQRKSGELEYDFGGLITYKFGEKDGREYVLFHDHGCRVFEREIVARIYENGELEYLDIKECECKYCVEHDKDEDKND